MSAMVERTLTSPLDREAARPPRPGFLTRVALLVHAHRARLLAYARRHGLDAEEALDAVQDSLITFLGLPEAQSIAHDSLPSLKLLTVILGHQVQNQRRNANVMAMRTSSWAANAWVWKSPAVSS